MSEDKSYCRLCASLKCNSKLIDLQIDEEKRCKIVDKLRRLNLSRNMTEDDTLPKTVCFICISALDKAFDFVSEVEKAQYVLNDLISIKKETAPSDDDLECDFEPINFVKEESEFTDLPNSNAEYNTDEKDKSGLDSIPLSQLKLTWKDYDWQCAYCDTLFPTVDELRTHSMQFHNCCNAFRCTDCNRRKLKLDKFVIHVKWHRKYLKLSCYKCCLRFSKAHDAKSHKMLHKTTDFACKGCNMSFSNAAELNQHTLEYNKDKRVRPIPIEQKLNSSLSCIFCKKTFKYKTSLDTHILIHTDRQREHICDKCGKCFLNKHNLAGHMMLHENKRPYQCEICKFSFRTRSQLRSHVGVHDGVKPFECDQCGRCFRLQRQLQNHSIIHTDLFPYTCKVCNKGFRFKTILNQHSRQHTGIKPYSCDICDRDFTNWPNYNKHMKRRHGMDMAKKKHTPDGLYPIDPATGEIIVYSEPNKAQKWKKELLNNAKKPGRPRNSKEDDLRNETDTL